MKKYGIGIVTLLVGKVGVKLVPTFLKLGLAGISAAWYAHEFSWKLATVLMGALFVHELGHIWEMKRWRLKTRGVYFIPFFGAIAVSEDAFPSREAQYAIAIMGPMWGFGLAAFTAAVYALTDYKVLASAAGWIAFLNLFNLLPVTPLDGGRVVSAIAFSVHTRVGLAFLSSALVTAAVLAWYVSLLVFAFLLVVGFLDLTMEYGRRNKSLACMAPGSAVQSLAAYFVLIGMHWAFIVYVSTAPGMAFVHDFFSNW